MIIRINAFDKKVDYFDTSLRGVYIATKQSLIVQSNKDWLRFSWLIILPEGYQ
jgi:hypothetical protein